ncbi:DUF4336 domain-containing protein [Woodsholea maritima]|uniref:DUF4336 domain-containing protein n=1 Tax=Woodsholea maritima TaxID=240237 RepID=UPI00036DA482|nr:DUF4336 domain-containing protein [Woodsholea maritima]
MLNAFGPNIWTAEGPVVTAALGFHYPTRMCVIRLIDDQLFICSPITLSDALSAAITALGQVRYLIAPNSLHDLYIADWKTAFPEAQIYTAPGLAHKRGDLVIAGELDDTPPTPWADAMDQVVMRGNALTEEVVFFHRESASVIFTDLLQNMPKGWYKGWRAVIAHLDLMTGDTPRVPRKFRVAFKDKAAARQALAQITQWPAHNVLMAHGTPIKGDGQAFIARSFDWLK